MENEIKVGEWVRTDNGIIGKYVKYRGIEDAIETDNKWIGFDIEKDIVKHSNNLIDLIEIGDLVKIEDNCGVIHWFEVYENSEIYQYEILEIVTKEMMESISYKVTKM